MEASTPAPPPPPPPAPPAPPRRAIRSAPTRCARTSTTGFCRWSSGCSHCRTTSSSSSCSSASCSRSSSPSSRSCSPAATRRGSSTTSPACCAGAGACRLRHAAHRRVPAVLTRGRLRTTRDARDRLPGDGVDRWRPLVAWLLILPYAIVAAVLMSVAGIVAFIGVFVILFTEGVAGGDVQVDPRPATGGSCAVRAYAAVHGHAVSAVRLRRALGTVFAQHLDHEPLRTAAVELDVEDRLPGAEVEPAGGHRDDHLVVDEQVLEVGVAVVLAAAVMAVVAGVRRAARGRRRWRVASSAAARACRAIRARRPGSPARRR